MSKEPDNVQRKVAAFARQPTIWTAPASGRTANKTDRWPALAVVRALVGVLLLSTVPPALLILVFGNPVELVPSWPVITDFLSDQQRRNAPQLVAAAVAVALWLLWALMMILLAGTLLSVVAGWRLPRWRLPAPLHRLLFGLAGTAAVAVVTTPHGNGNADEVPVQPVASTPQKPGASAVERGTVTVLVGHTRYEYEVKRGDTLSKIARQWLGDADRWPELCRLNRHQHQADGTELTDCDLIYPGWQLRLPADARPPTRATPAHPSGPPVAAAPSATPSASPSTTTTPTAESPMPSSASVHESAGTRSATPSTTASKPGTSAATPSSTTSRTPASSASPPEPKSAPPQADPIVVGAACDEHGVQLSPESWMPWTIAAAISAAVALLWRQRRRRYTGEPDDGPPTELPTPVETLRRVVTRNPELAGPDTGDAEPPGASGLAPLPPGGTGLVGSGAPAAARGMLVAVLASGGPHHPDARAEVVIDSATLATLLGPDATALGPWPRLHVTDSVDDALSLIEARLLHRSRILDEHALTDLDQLRQTSPSEEALPPVMLITETPPANARMRAQTIVGLGQGLRVSALLLGEWEHGATVEVAPDGHTTLLSGPSTDPVPPRLPVLDPAAAIQFLATLREAQTGEPSEPPAAASPTTPVKIVPLHASRTDIPRTDTPPTASAAGAPETGRARLRVLGPPRIEDITADGRPLRAKALELAVFLAVHPDGATTREIGEYLEPDARISQADQRVHTNASNLRHVLGRASTAQTKNAYVIKSAGRYRLDPATVDVDVDVWTLRELMRAATIAAEPRRRELLSAACHLCAAPLAEGQDYDWIQPHRETVRRWGTEAHLMLADDLLDSDPQAASDLLDKAIGFDRYNEALYVKAMHTRHALGDADGIRTLQRALTKALADLDAEPREETIALATQLRTSLNNQ